MSTTHPALRIVIAGMILTAFCASTAFPQSVTFTRWKNNAAGAYSLSHDDAGYPWWGDYALVDSLLLNRGITVSFNLIPGFASRADSIRGALFVSRGHRYNSHSLYHICDTPLTSPATMAREYDTAKALIERKFAPSQGKCLYFMAPCGNQTAANITYLRTKEYIGCRNDVNGISPVPYNVPDPFRIAEACYSAGENLNAAAQSAITSGNWVTRYGHCVSDVSTLGWMPIPTATYRAHLDWCRQQIDAGNLWMAPTQTVLMYALERSRWRVAVTSSGATAMLVGINTDSVINPNVANRLFNVPLTVSAGLPSGWSSADVQVMQNGRQLAKTVVDGTTIRFDAAPWDGTVTINRTAVGIVQPAGRAVQAVRAGAVANVFIGNSPVKVPAGMATYGVDGKRAVGSAGRIIIMAPAAGVRP